MVDLSQYKARIVSTDDFPLFDEAIKAAASGALRAAYIMIWLACAESLKRKFREAKIRDSAAGVIVGTFERKEAEQKAIDKFVLDKAKEYGFVSDSAHAILQHVYEMRCVYGHPYEQEPTPQQVIHAASVVVDHVLALPVKLRHSFGRELLNKLLRDINYLDDQFGAVDLFVKDIIIPKMDFCIFQWFFKQYWQSLETRECKIICV